MALPGSKRQRDKLGARLVESSAPAPADLDALHVLLGLYGDALDQATPRIEQSTGYPLTSRVKNTGTLLEKLRRDSGSGLGSTQDLAGARIVDGTRSSSDQDRIVDQLVSEFGAETKEPKVIDRRSSPSHGYRAVHVIVYPDGVQIEVQVRSEWQHAWAERFEKFADLVGRDVRYGGDPTFPGLSRAAAENALLNLATRRVLKSLDSLSRIVAAAEERESDRIGSLLALRDRWIVDGAFAAVDATIAKLEQVVVAVATSAESSDETS